MPLKLAVLAIGKIKERHYQDACTMYIKRMQVMQPVEVQELPEEPIPQERNQSLVDRALEREGRRILACLRKDDIAVAMTPRGECLDSVAFAAKLNPLPGSEAKRLVFILGSSHGLSDDVYAHCQWELSFGPMTFPHQLARVMLLEQLYRGQMILRGSAYHK